MTRKQLSLSRSRLHAALALVLMAWGLAEPSLGHPLAPQGGNEKVMRDLLAAYPRGGPSAVTSTPDGSVLYVGEGGSLAIIDNDISSPTLQDLYRHPIKRVDVGHQGVVPVRMLLDPAASNPPGAGADDFLYIAGGRDGLWLMEAEATSPTHVNLAWRVDDKGTQRNINYQRSRKWCSDLAIVTLGRGATKEPYLVALFARQDASHLCFYKLSLVKGVAAGGETGAEIQPEKLLLVKRHSNLSLGDFSYGFAMAADSHYDAVEDSATADLYLAMGRHGLARVTVSHNGTALDTSLSWGPVFGDGSAFATHDPQLYSTLKFRNGAQGDVEFAFAPHFLDVAVDPRPAPNHRLYAAVDHLGVVSFDLDATWTEDMYSPPGTQGGDFHQEGLKHAAGAWGKYGVQLIADPLPGAGSLYQFARNVEVVETHVAGQPGMALVVGTDRELFVRDPGVKNHGRSHDYLGRAVGGIAGYLLGTVPATGGFKGTNSYALVYDITNVYDTGSPSTAWHSGAMHAAGFSRIGPEIHVFESQASDSLSLCAGGWIRADKLLTNAPSDAIRQDFVRVDYGAIAPQTAVVPAWPPSGTLPENNYDFSAQRDAQYRRGRWLYAVAPSPLSGNLLETGFNDAGLYPDGPLTLDLSAAATAPNIVANFDVDPSVAGWDDLNKHASNGITFEPMGAIVQNGKEYRFAYARGPKLDDSGQQVSAGNPPTLQFEPVWRVSRFDLGTNIYDPQAAARPQMEKHIFLRPRKDKFNERPRVYYSSGFISEEYNNWVAATYPDAPTKRFAFMTLNNTPEGMRVLDLDAAIALLDNPSTASGQPFYLGNTPGISVGEFTTHPEWWNVPHYLVNSAAERFAALMEDEYGSVAANLVTMYPTILRLPATGGGEDRWILAVPCGAAYCDERNADPYKVGFYDYPGWIPDTEFQSGAGYERMLVRLFDVSDPSKISERQTSPSPVPGQTGSYTLPASTILGGGERQSSAFDLTYFGTTDAQSARREFVFVANFGGSLEVFEVTDVFAQPAAHSTADPSYLHFGSLLSGTVPFARVDTRESLSDDNPTSAWGVAVDEIQWKDSSEVVHDEVWVYLSVGRVGIEVYKFDVDAALPEDRLVWTDLIQTAGEGGFLHLWDEPSSAIYNPLISDPLDRIGWVTDPSGLRHKKLLFVGDTAAGFRVFTYEHGGGQ